MHGVVSSAHWQENTRALAEKVVLTVLRVGIPPTAIASPAREVDIKMNWGSTAASGVMSANLHGHLTINPPRAGPDVWTSVLANQAIIQ